MKADEMKTRLYMEFCPFGGLDRWTQWYFTDLRARTPKKHKERDTIARSWLPEPFLWHVFECLANAGVLMERGELDRAGLEDWDTILHLDLKTSNVFLGPPSTERYRGYPVPKIGDFGSCVIQKRHDSRKVKDYPMIGGSGYNRPPEQTKYPFNQRFEARKPPLMDSLTNVWGVGELILRDLRSLGEC